MAISKKQQKISEAPDPRAFLRLIDERLADETVVVAAFGQALTEHLAGKSYSERLQEVFESGGVLKERPALDAEPSPAARMIELRRYHSFKGGV